MKKLLKTLPMAAILINTIVFESSWADTTSGTTSNSTSNTTSLEQRLDVLEQEVAELKKELQQQKQAAAQNTQQVQAVGQGQSTQQAQAAGPVIYGQTVQGAINQGQPAAISASNGSNVFSIRSQDGNYKLEIGGYAQLEAREFADNNKEELDEDSSIIPRRVRLRIDGTVAHDFDFFIQPDFGYNNAFSSITSTTPSTYSPSLMDAWIDYSHYSEAVVKIGKMKTPFDLENLQDSRFNSFVELGLTGNLSPQRDIGGQVGGTLWNNRITYAGGIYDGAADHENGYGGYSTTAGGDTNGRSGTGRIFVEPFKGGSIGPLNGLGAGFAASYGKEKGTDLPSYVTEGQAPFFSYNSNVSAAGPQLRTEPQAYYYYKSLGILGEKVTDQESLEYTGGTSAHPVIYRDKPDNKAWEVTSTYVLTGENASYNGVVPFHDFNPSLGHWGAFELAGRYGELKLDSSIFSEGFANLNTSASEAQEWGIGLNWYLNPNLKLVLDYVQTDFDRGATVAGGNDGDRKTENLYMTMFQLSL